MKTAELKSKIITQLRFHRVSGKHEDLTADHIIEIMQSNLWTSPCTCPPDEKTGETLCCNEQLGIALPEKVKRLKEVFVEITGENPWD